jgi:hypothetical protein
MKIIEEKDSDPRTYNQSTADEIAVILPTSNEICTGSDRDIIVRGRTTESNPHPLQRIPYQSPLYHPLYYVLLFPRGEEGYKKGLTSVSPRSVNKSRTIREPHAPALPEIVEIAQG